MLQPSAITAPTFLPPERATFIVKLSYIAILVWGFTMTCVKTSAALTLLRIPQTRFSTIMLYLIVALQIVFIAANSVYLLFIKCRPLEAAWDLGLVNAYCQSPRVDVLVSHVGSTINIITDVFLSLAPMIILWHLRRPLRERILVCGLTGIGLIASLASGVKVIMIQKWGGAEDLWALAMSISSWTVIEQFVAIIAACSPSLKGPIQRALERLGIELTKIDSKLSFIYMPSRAARNPHGSRYEVDSEVGGYPGLITGSGVEGHTLDMLGKNESPTASASVSISTLRDGSVTGENIQPAET